MRCSVMELHAVSYRHLNGLEISVQSERLLLYLQVAIISKTCFYLCVHISFMVQTHIPMCKTWISTFLKNHYPFKVLI